jgi:hypothetical protein
MSKNEEKKSKGLLNILFHIYIPTYLNGKISLLNRHSRLIKDCSSYVRGRILAITMLFNGYILAFLSIGYLTIEELLRSISNTNFSGFDSDSAITGGLDVSFLEYYKLLYGQDFGQSFLPLSPNLELNLNIGNIYLFIFLVMFPILNRTMAKLHYIVDKTGDAEVLLRRSGYINENSERKCLLTKVGLYVYLDKGDGKAVKENKDIWMILNLRPGQVISNPDDMREFIITSGFELPDRIIY